MFSLFLVFILHFSHLTRTEPEVPNYILLTAGEEEICNVELLYIKLLEWANATKDTTIVEPFVCDSFIGGLPGWSFGGLGLFNREPLCPLKPFSWYRDIFSSHTGVTLKKTISYSDFVKISSRCDDPPDDSEFTPGVQSGNCLEICLMILTDWGRPKNNDFSCNQERLDQYHMVEKFNPDIPDSPKYYDVVDPLNGKETALSIVGYECWHPQTIDEMGGVKFLLNRAIDMKNRNLCRTASLALHRLGKEGIKTFYNEPWHKVEEKYLDTKFSQAMIDIAAKFKKEKLAEKYIAVQFRALKPSMSGDFDIRDMEGIRQCFKKIVDTTSEQMKKLGISKIFLAADALARNSTTWFPDDIPDQLDKNFKEVVLNSGLPWATNLETDPFAENWKHDRGAQGLIDQIIAIDSTLCIITGTGSFSKRIMDLREIEDRETMHIFCEPSPGYKPPPDPSPTPVPTRIKLKNLVLPPTEITDTDEITQVTEDTTQTQTYITQPKAEDNISWKLLLSFLWLLGAGVIVYKLRLSRKIQLLILAIISILIYFIVW